MKYYKNLKYILRHKWFVFLECAKRGLYWRGLTHDMSKFFPDEFFAYAESFYGEHPMTYNGAHTPGYVQEFDKAWLKHIHRNKHHWQHWILHCDDEGDKIVRMPDEYAIEMICDWVGAGKAQGKISPRKDPYLELREWYKKHKTKIKLHSKTREFIEDIIFN